MSAWRSGWRRVYGAPGVAAGVFALTFLLALPLAITMRGLLQAHLGDSMMAAGAADGVNYDWWQEFTSQATGLGTTFTPSIIGFAATLDSVSSVLDARRQIAPVAGALALYLAGWTFIIGGVIDRYARQRQTRAYGFFAAGGFNLSRLLRLAVIAAFIYWWLFAYVHRWLFGEWYVDQTRGLSLERDAFLWRIALYGVFGLLLALANILFDYAKIRLVVEDRRSAIGALAGAARFIWRHSGRTLALYGLNALTFLALIAVWALVAPGAGRAGYSMWLVFFLGQLYVIARLLLKLQFMASQIALFQSKLAHAAYTAAPAPRWPESPAAEVIAPGPTGHIPSVLFERRDWIDMSGAQRGN